MRFVTTLRSPTRAPLLQVAKTSAAAIIAWLASQLLLGQPLPIFAAIAALLVVQPSVNQTVLKGIERSVGVIAGVVIAYVSGQLFGAASWVILVVIVISLLLAWALKLGPGSTNQIPISAMLVLALGAQTPGYALERILETIIGALVGLLVNLAIVPPVSTAPAHRAVRELVTGVADVLDDLALTLSSASTNGERAALMERARSLRGGRDAAASALVQAVESLTLNPRRGLLSHALEKDDELFRRLSVLTTRVLGVVRAVHDHYSTSLIGDATTLAIAKELGRAAHDLRLVGADNARPDVPTVTAELPALTAPLTIAAPSPDQWILIGSLMEDIRRVREEISGTSES
ncbi:MAG: FUSC family protein [Salinibacterium sp.]|nr:FUSC family protein [Salinibacterium sp.]